MAIYNSKDEIIENLDENGYIYGEVVLEIEDIVDAEPEDFVDLLSEELVANDALLEVDYRALAVDTEGRVVIGVYGDPRIVIKDLEMEELDFEDEDFVGDPG